MSTHPEGPYTDEFYRHHRDGALRSAREIVPLILEFVAPRSVVDVGCGIGAWLSVFRERGITDILGVDGEWVGKNQLLIPEDRFAVADMQKRLVIDRRFDLALSLEVAEHLPPECAADFVDSVTSLAPVVVFSAAIPFQGGVNHVNEQWPEYWVEHFTRNGYSVIDGIRNAIWRNEAVEWYYAQNILMFASSTAIERSEPLRAARERTSMTQLALVHPRKYLNAIVGMQTSHLVSRDIASTIPSGATFILVDDDVIGRELSVEGRVIPFLERDGQYWGRPADDETAIREVERLREGGARFIVFSWPALWWLEHYGQFHEYLRSRFPCRRRTEHIVVFDLQRQG